ncbi:urea ABC transporter ATP-binding subunit UrtE [Candidatus Synechococcus spongiarum LMB bulk10D]|nr:urea ABC transporter ATP-binding subunit UrtE [Candidatus Synechococcus spongiarum LMB bulk10D]
MTVSSPTEFHNRNTPEPLLRISGLTTCYGESRILRDVDLQVHGGQMVCLIGRNGVGKTTLLKTVMGLIRPQRGRIHLAGRDLLALPPHQRARAGIGYVPQGRDIIPQLTVRDNLRLGLEARPGGLARHDRLDPQVFDLFPVLDTMLERRGGDLSGGQQQQLAMARALQGKPRLLLLDEPTEGIQPNVVADIEKAVRRIMAQTGVSVLLVEQHLHFVRQAHTYYAMQKGGIVASGPTAGLSQSVINRFLSV